MEAKCNLIKHTVIHSDKIYRLSGWRDFVVIAYVIAFVVADFFVVAFFFFWLLFFVLVAFFCFCCFFCFVFVAFFCFVFVAYFCCC